MTNAIKDGWHRVKDVDVYVEDGIVKHGTDLDHTRTLYPYRYLPKERAWTSVRVKFSTFKSGYGKVYSMK